MEQVIVITKQITMSFQQQFTFSFSKVTINYLLKFPMLFSCTQQNTAKLPKTTFIGPSNWLIFVFSMSGESFRDTFNCFVLDLCQEVYMAVNLSKCDGITSR